MHTQFVVNGEIKLIIAPETEYEKELLKALLKQENEFTEFRNPITVIDKTYTNGVVITRKGLEKLHNDLKNDKSEFVSNKS